MTDNFITIKTFSYPHEVAIIRGRLESEEIECFVQDELTLQVNPFYSNAIGGVKLQVRESDVERAMKILEENDSFDEEKLSESVIETKNSVSDSSSSMDKVCPYCSSTEISKPRYSAQAFAVSILLLGFPLPFISKEHHCFDCGKDFKK